MIVRHALLGRSRFQLPGEPTAPGHEERSSSESPAAPRESFFFLSFTETSFNVGETSRHKEGMQTLVKLYSSSHERPHVRDLRSKDEESKKKKKLLSLAALEVTSQVLFCSKDTCV